MNDFQLIVRAANAAGYTIEFDTKSNQTIYIDNVEWNPLIDDSDALKLAVDMSLVIYQLDEGYESYAGEQIRGGVYVPHQGDSLASTRRAIVLAASDMCYV